MKRFRIIFFLGLIALLSVTSSCNKRRYPCPGNGTMSAQQLSLFDEEGNLKSETSKKKKKKSDNGLVNKKQDDRLKNRRKVSLDDKPKNMKK